jgi:tetratricopeptide (TPR) repeat protein
MKKVLLSSLFILLFVSALSNALADQAHPPRLTLRGERLYTEGKYSEALMQYKGLLSRQPEPDQVGEIHSRIGDCYFKLGDYPNALQAYRSALEGQKPAERPSTQYWIGFCSFLLGRDKEAVAEFLKIPARYPDSGMWVTTAYYWAGRASERMGQKEQAAEYYRKAGGKGKSTQERFAMKRAEAARDASTKAQAPNPK